MSRRIVLCIIGAAASVSLSCNSIPTDSYGPSEIRMQSDRVLECTLHASDTSLAFGGGTVVLAWTSRNANSATIDPDIGAVSLQGDTVISVSRTTTFRLTVSNGLNVETAIVTIVVRPFEFIYPLAIGNRWTYRYSYGNSECSPPTRTCSGWYENSRWQWEVVGADSAVDSIVYILRNSTIDTVVSYGTTSISSDTSYCTIVLTRDQIIPKWPVMVNGLPYGGEKPGGSLPLYPVSHDSLVTMGACRYVNHVGLVGYEVSMYTMTVIAHESLSLLSYAVQPSLSRAIGDGGGKP